MEYQLQQWDQGDLEAYLEDHPDCEESINLPWVVVEKVSPDTEVVAYSSGDRYAAMGFVMQRSVWIAYMHWEDDLGERFGLDSEIIERCVLECILNGEEQELIKLESRPPEGI